MSCDWGPAPFKAGFAPSQKHEIDWIYGLIGQAEKGWNKAKGKEVKIQIKTELTGAKPFPINFSAD